MLDTNCGAQRGAHPERDKAATAGQQQARAQLSLPAVPQKKERSPSGDRSKCTRKGGEEMGRVQKPCWVKKGQWSERAKVLPRSSSAVSTVSSATRSASAAESSSLSPDGTVEPQVPSTVTSVRE